jgi:hypothetical protein
MDQLPERIRGHIWQIPISKNAQSVIEIDRKLRCIAAVLLDAAATKHEKANAEALKIRLEKRLGREVTTEGARAIVPYKRIPTPSLWRPGRPPSDLTKVLIASAIVAPLAGYFFLENSHQYTDVAISSLPQGMLQSAGPTGIAVESMAEPGVQLQPALPFDINRNESEIKTMPDSSLAHQTSPERSVDAMLDAPDKTIIGQRHSLAGSMQEFTCLPSASAVRQDHPGAWPAWTLRVLGHEGTKCWHPTSHAAARNSASGRPARS